MQGDITRCATGRHNIFVNLLHRFPDSLLDFRGPLRVGKREGKGRGRKVIRGGGRGRGGGEGKEEEFNVTQLKFLAFGLCLGGFFVLVVG